MSIAQYVGARYVPKFYENSDLTAEWRSGVIYEPLTIVTWNTNSYTSKKKVPASVGNPSDNPDYWVVTGNFNAQYLELAEKVDKNTLARKNIYPSSDYTITDAINSNEECVYRVNNGDVYLGSITIPKRVTIEVVNGKISGNIVLEGEIVAGRQKIFADECMISAVGQTWGYPEWFGGDIQKCYDTFNVTLLDDTDYYIDDTLVFNKSHKCVMGKYPNSNFGEDGANKGARIIATFNDKSAIRVGSGGTDRSSTQNYLRYFSISCLTPNYASNACVGLEVYGCRACICEWIICSNFRDGFKMGEATLSYFINCRYITNKSAEIVNTVIGFHLAGASESIYMIDCDVTFANVGDTSDFGLYAQVDSGFADFIVKGLSVSRAANGIALYGNASASRQQNIWIIDCCVDNCIEALRISQKLKVNVIGNWFSCGVYGSGTRRGIHLVSFTGIGSFIGNHIKLGDNTTLDGYGLRLENSKNAVFKGNIINCFNHGVYANGCSCIDIEDIFVLNSADSSANCIVLEGTTNAKVASVINGDYKYDNGVQITGNCSGVLVDASCIAAGSVNANKVIIAGVAQTNNNIYQALANNNSIIGCI